MSEPTRVFDFLTYAEEKYVRRDMLAAKKDGKWDHYSLPALRVLVDTLSRGLIKLGIRPDDKVAIMSPNRPEWNIADFAIMQIGAVQVPMYPTLAPQDIEFIVRDAGVRLIFVADQALYEKLQAVLIGFPDILIYTFDKVEGIGHWAEIQGDATVNLNSFRDIITSDHLVTLIYTSGTTGTPKGVMLSHGNLVSNVIASSVMYPKTFQKAVSFLPLSHVFERMVLYMYFYLGISVYYAQSMDTIAADIADVKPNGFTTVPRLLEKVYDRIIEKGSQLTGLKLKLFRWAVDLGLRYELKGANGRWYEFQLAIARKLIFSKWRDALGGNIVAIVSGGAALQPRLARVFWAAGMPVLEGYGLTETSPVITVNGLGKDQMRFSTVGKPISNVEVKIAEDGEILCKGPNLMKGYYRNPELTAQVIDEEGYFHTGDIGELVDGQFLRITDRKKEIFKTAGGKYIAPQVLENKLKESPLIEHVIVIGENERFPAALILPAFPALRNWCEKAGISCGSNEEMAGDPRIEERIWSEVQTFNQEFGNWERIKKICLLSNDWSIDGGELTPKLSLRRKAILEKYRSQVERIYRNEN